MDKYFALSKMLEFVDKYADVVDADMNYYNGSVHIEGENEAQTIVIEVTITNKEK